MFNLILCLVIFFLFLMVFNKFLDVRYTSILIINNMLITFITLTPVLPFFLMQLFLFSLYVISVFIEKSFLIDLAVLIIYLLITIVITFFNLNEVNLVILFAVCFLFIIIGIIYLYLINKNYISRSLIQEKIMYTHKEIVCVYFITFLPILLYFIDLHIFIAYSVTLFSFFFILFYFKIEEIKILGFVFLIMLISCFFKNIFSIYYLIYVGIYSLIYFGYFYNKKTNITFGSNFIAEYKKDNEIISNHLKLDLVLIYYLEVLCKILPVLVLCIYSQFNLNLSYFLFLMLPLVIIITIYRMLVIIFFNMMVGKKTLHLCKECVKGGLLFGGSYSLAVLNYPENHWPFHETIKWHVNRVCYNSIEDLNDYRDYLDENPTLPKPVLPNKKWPTVDKAKIRAWKKTRK